MLAPHTTTKLSLTTEEQKNERSSNVKVFLRAITSPQGMTLPIMVLAIVLAVAGRWIPELTSFSLGIMLCDLVWHFRVNGSASLSMLKEVWVDAKAEVPKS